MLPRIRSYRAAAALAGLAAAALLAGAAEARNNIRNEFFAQYPQALGTQLDTLPSTGTHCGVCHFDFNGGGPRNPHGLAIEVGLNNGLTRAQAIAAIAGDDSDGDGYTNFVEITDLAGFSNTPTFPGLTSVNVGSISNVTPSDVTPYLTPAGASDVTPPAVAVLTPNGAEVLSAGTTTTVTYSATDSAGVTRVDFYLSGDGGTSWKPVGKSASPTGSFSWFVPNRPGVTNLLRVVAFDQAGNAGSDESDAAFTIDALPAGYVATTLRDMDLPGTQPFEGAILEDVELFCQGCHGNYDHAVEPYFNWNGSMMGQAMRDPLFLACVAVAEQDAPSVGDLCLRCHTPGGWQEGRSVDTSGGQLTDKDRQGIQCDFCHRMVDPIHDVGIDPVEDVAVLADLETLPVGPANGQFINDPAPVRRGPYADAQASHDFLDSGFHRRSDLCGTCHDVSNPVFEASGDRYVPTAMDQPHPDGDRRNMFPVERTYSEWQISEYATTGVYAPQFAGDKPDGIVSSCQDCHMQDVTGRASALQSPIRSDLGLHDFTGGNTFIPDILPDFYPADVDTAALQDAKTRATSMLQLAATLAGTPEDFGLTVRVTNETAHKLPSGYPEGRRIWLNVVAVDGSGVPVFESGAYDPGTAELTHDDQIKVYEIEPGLSPGLAGALGLPAGQSFHFVLNDTIYSDNRIPPRGVTNAALEAIQSPVVAHAYPDGQYWDDTAYILPATADTARVTLYYQTLTREYVEFLRDANTTNSAGQDLYDAWDAHGRSTPVAMAEIVVPLGDIGTAAEPILSGPALEWTLGSGRPNPMRTSTTIGYSVPERSRVSLTAYDAAGRRVATLADGVREPGRYQVVWNGRNSDGQAVAAGVYYVKLRSPIFEATRRVTMLR